MMHVLSVCRKGQGYSVIRYSMGLCVGIGTARVAYVSCWGVWSSASAMVSHSCRVITRMKPTQQISPHSSQSSVRVSSPCWSSSTVYSITRCIRDVLGVPR